MTLEQHKHVLCESPIALSTAEFEELRDLAKTNKCILFDAIRTAYSTAYHQLLLLVKSGVIGEVVSVDSICTSLRNLDPNGDNKYKNAWNSICSWGPTAMLPIFQILGVDYLQKNITSKIIDEDSMYDSFTKIAFVYPKAVASLKVGNGVKSEGELIISGTKGYIYVPAPWWKTDYFEIRHENPADNKRYFYQLDGEGIRNELVSFIRAINYQVSKDQIEELSSFGFVKILNDYYHSIDLDRI